MNIDMILKSDVLDILFEKRNKLYGAYVLRKFYPERVKTSLLIMLGMVFIFFLLTLIPAKKSEDAYTFREGAILANIATEYKKPEAKRKVTSTSKLKINTRKLPGIITIVPETDSSDLRNIDPDKITGSVNITNGIDFPGNEGLENVPSGVASSSNVKEVIPVNPQIPVDNPDVEPSYPGGTKAFRDFLQRNLINPRDLDEGEQVSVRIKFIVGYDGSLKSFETEQSGGEEFNKEVIRVLKKMPHWIPGKANGNNVSVYYTIPVKFVSKE